MNQQAGIDITGLLLRWRNGEGAAADQLINALYPTLKLLARQNLHRFRGSLTLSATELVHETFERLEPQHKLEWQNRDHLLAIATTLMRRAAVDYLRGRQADKRGGGIVPRQLESLLACEEPAFEECRESIDLQRALQELAAGHPQIAVIAELKLFSGMTKEDIASCCSISTATVVRHWRFARAWLTDRLGGPSAGDVEHARA
jgi:RNA polymerase sigma factor (TIGR02999 family)